jgi:hypothetical protein
MLNLRVARDVTMRSDMPKVIVERPRIGLRKVSRGKSWDQNSSPDDLPTKEGMRFRHTVLGTRRELNENLAPLRRYLSRQVGRPWDKVYSEIRAHIGAGSAVQLHVLQHLWQFVERYVTVGERGVVCAGPLYFGRAPYSLRAGELYIHPQTGRLERVRSRCGKGRRARARAAG